MKINEAKLNVKYRLPDWRKDRFIIVEGFDNAFMDKDDDVYSFSLSDMMRTDWVEFKTTEEKLKEAIEIIRLIQHQLDGPSLIRITKFFCSLEGKEE